MFLDAATSPQFIINLGSICHPFSSGHEQSQNGVFVLLRLSLPPISISHPRDWDWDRAVTQPERRSSGCLSCRVSAGLSINGDEALLHFVPRIESRHSEIRQSSLAEQMLGPLPLIHQERGGGGDCKEADDDNAK